MEFVKQLEKLIKADLRKIAKENKQRIKTGLAGELKKGDWFRLPRQRYFRFITYISELEDRTGIPENDRGKLLIVVESCQQMVLDKSTEIQFWIETKE